MYFVPTTDFRQPRRVDKGTGTPPKQPTPGNAMLSPFHTAASTYDQFMEGGSRKLAQAKAILPNQFHRYQDGQASKWVSAFKIGFSLLVAGGINAFLFGVPIWVAAGLSAGVAGIQSALALKIHKEDNAFSKGVVSLTRKVMRRKDDYTPSGKEWSMVPVWGVICGLMALVESMGNHAYKKFFTKDMNKPAQLVLEERQTALRKILKKPANFMHPIYRLQSRGVELTLKVMDKIKTWLQNMAAAEGWKKAVGEKLQKLWQGGRSMKAAYLWACGMAVIGGIFQTSVAAYMQGKIDKRNGFK
jgi:hypothetical protein